MLATGKLHLLCTALLCCIADTCTADNKQLVAGASVSITVQPCLWQLQVLRNKKIFTNPDSMNNGCGSATDGDLDAAYALLLAGQKWHDPLYTERGIEARSKHVVKHASCT